MPPFAVLALTQSIGGAYRRNAALSLTIMPPPKPRPHNLMYYDLIVSITTTVQVC